ncbi:tumor necrosis factor receptor superfamily member 6-like [Megalops cyprinoides]|uniref:tumor necrosis factor receptor superfamily member 6-like n=1 Tax=Megalops cyprinoides TaxID=118141 RepID=UPI0018640DA6|nr:tumor necrosis factor receptor superfamily member 6-like [Megalops cyprinoides]
MQDDHLVSCLYAHPCHGVNVDISENTPLKGIDLSPHLYKIVDELGPHLTKQLAISSGMTEARIDFHMTNNQNNSTEQYYNVLKDWTEQQGLENAFPNLIRELRKLGKNKIADKLQKKILEKV